MQMKKDGVFVNVSEYFELSTKIPCERLLSSHESDDWEILEVQKIL